MNETRQLLGSSDEKNRYLEKIIKPSFREGKGMAPVRCGNSKYFDMPCFPNFSAPPLEGHLIKAYETELGTYSPSTIRDGWLLVEGDPHSAKSVGAPPDTHAQTYVGVLGP
jgi:hypothetical protein